MAMKRIDASTRVVGVLLSDVLFFEMYDPKHELPDILDVPHIDGRIKLTSYEQFEGRTAEGFRVIVERHHRNGFWSPSVTVTAPSAGHDYDRSDHTRRP